MEKSSSGITMSIAPGDLGTPGQQLGRGGQAVVIDLPDLKLPDVAGQLVYKKYREPHSDPQSLRRIVDARHNLDLPTRKRLDAVTVWPVRVVEENGQALGIVMPKIPAAYFDQVVLPGTGSKKRVLREVQNLFIPPERAAELGRPKPSDEQRLRICRDFAGVLTLMHDTLGVVFGDINAMNELFRLDDTPMVMFLDCDGVRPKGSVASVKQLNAPDWVPPGNEVLSRASDLYKLGLFVLRCLTPGPGTSVCTDPDTIGGALDSQGLAMVRRALGPDLAARPLAREWEVYLRRTLGEPVAPPRVGAVSLDRTIVLKGQSVVVEWEAFEATEIRISAGPGRTEVVKARGAHERGSTPIAPLEAAVIEVSAINALGADHRSAGPVDVFEPPVQQPLPVPIPDLPSLRVDVPVPDGIDRMPPLPVIGIPQPRLDLRPPAPQVFEWPAIPDTGVAHFPIDFGGFFADAPRYPFDEESGR
ncbi:hypothetical protein [Lentzea kentuckyensis]|uniref:hypothetical protein n=1 Tax=Lentzea kentuckyensis TaxID=360086 RepID=UPI00117B4FC8|nr:hypothetical protein [Lentzea kentuckyensis]